MECDKIMGNEQIYCFIADTKYWIKLLHDACIHTCTYFDKVSHPKDETKEDHGYIHFNQPRILIGLTFEALRLTNFIEMSVYVTYAVINWHFPMCHFGLTFYVLYVWTCQRYFNKVYANVPWTVLVDRICFFYC